MDDSLLWLALPCFHRKESRPSELLSEFRGAFSWYLRGMVLRVCPKRIHQTYSSSYSKLTYLSLLVMNYIQELKTEFNPEVVAFLMDHSDHFTCGYTSTPFVTQGRLSSEVQCVQAQLCAQNFLDYAEC